MVFDDAVMYYSQIGTGEMRVSVTLARRTVGGPASVGDAQTPGQRLGLQRGDIDIARNLVADQMAGKRAFGVADAILRQLLPAPAAAPALNVADSQKMTPPLNQQQ